MDLKQYEIITIFKEGPEFEESRKGFREILSRNKAEIAKEEEMGIRKLHFEIQHQNNGHFVLTKCSAAPEKVKDISHEMKIHGGILRYMIKRL